MAPNSLVLALWLAQAPAAPGAPAVTPMPPPDAGAASTAAAPAQPAPPPPTAAAPAAAAPPAPASAPPAAQPEAAPPPPAAVPPSEAGVPPPRRGFQGAVSLQVATPGGHAVKDVRHRDVVMVSQELELQAGFKLTRRLFLGAYGALGATTPARDAWDTCVDRRMRRECTGGTVRAGLFTRVDLTPRQLANLWVGAGVGVEGHTVELPVAGTLGSLTTEEQQFGGGEVRLMLGFDLRANRVVGFGFWGALSGGTYEDIHLKDGTVIANQKAPHSWATIGVRGILFP